MPLALLQYKTNRGIKELAEKLAKALPDIIAPNLTLPEREQLDGLVTPHDIVVWCVGGGKADVNTQDLEIIIWGHDSPERRANLEERKEAILKDVRRFLAEHADYDHALTGFVWVLLQPTAFGKLLE
jgi:hypothetical protein